MIKHFPAIDPSEWRVLTFDFTDDLLTTETLTGSIAVSLAVLKGTDPTPAGLLSGSASFDVNNKKVTQAVKGTFEGTTYAIKVVVPTSDPLKKLALTGILPVTQG